MEHGGKYTWWNIVFHQDTLAVDLDTDSSSYGDTDADGNPTDALRVRGPPM